LEGKQWPDFRQKIILCFISNCNPQAYAAILRFWKLGRLHLHHTVTLNMGRDAAGIDTAVRGVLTRIRKWECGIRKKGTLSLFVLTPFSRPLR
jgi:hypothetical protein